MHFAASDSLLPSTSGGFGRCRASRARRSTSWPSRCSDGDLAAAHALVEANLRFVVAVALQYRRYGIPIWELIAEGSLGLMMAVRKFDPERGTRFVTYAGYWIRAYVLDLVVKSTSMVGAGSGVLRSKLFFRLRRERAQIASIEQDPERRLELLAQRFNVDADKARSMLTQLDARDVSLDVSVLPESSLTLLDTLRDDGEDQERELMSAETSNARARRAQRSARRARSRASATSSRTRIMSDERAVAGRARTPSRRVARARAPARGARQAQAAPPAGSARPGRGVGLWLAADSQNARFEPGQREVEVEQARSAAGCRARARRTTRSCGVKR